MRFPAMITVFLLWHAILGAAVRLADLLAFTSISLTPPTEATGAPLHPSSTSWIDAANSVVVQNLDLRDAPLANLPAVDNANKAAPNPAVGALDPNPMVPIANPAAPNADPVAHPNAIPNPAAPNANPATLAAPGNPALNPAGGPAAPVAAPPAAPPAKPTTAAPSVTVQWVETWIGGTSQTWVPQTFTFNMKGFVTEAPKPGKGEIGLGTIKGEVGVTKTVLMGDAPNIHLGWMGGVVVIGIGAVGIL